MKELHLSIVSPEKSIFDGDVKIVTLPGTIGSFSILPGHAPIVSSLKAGTLRHFVHYRAAGDHHAVGMDSSIMSAVKSASQGLPKWGYLSNYF